MASEKKKEVLRSLKFVLFSASAGIIQVVSFALMNELIASDKEYGVSYFVALILSVLKSLFLKFRTITGLTMT